MVSTSDGDHPEIPNPLTVVVVAALQFLRQLTVLADLKSDDSSYGSVCVRRVNGRKFKSLL